MYVYICTDSRCCLEDACLVTLQLSAHVTCNQNSGFGTAS